MRKFITPGLLLLLVGTAALQWVLAERRKEQKQAAYYRLKHNSELNEHLKLYKQWLRLPPDERTGIAPALLQDGKIKTKAQLLQEQAERLKADIDKLAAGEMDTSPYADVLYGENWREEVSKYKKQKELREFILTCSILSMLIGGAVCAGCLVIWLATVAIRRRKEPEDDNSSNKTDIDKSGSAPRMPLTQLLGLGETARELTAANADKQKDIDIDRLLSAEESIKSETRKSQMVNRQSRSGLRARSPGSGLISDTRHAIRLDDSLRSQLENLEKHLEQIRQLASNSFLEKAAKYQVAQDIKLAVDEQSRPINNTLSELAQQVAAIREYASSQQDRVKKLQEGYDLNIIKNFCLRVIRCIDNLESCISKQSEQNNDTTHLKEARDELLFALESSGVEQFEPEINSDYRGQERLAEAVKEKERCDDPSLVGKIAKVIKPGYQYFIDEDNVKVVRPAMVKLFG